MCGIVGYAGHKPARPIILEGLCTLEYRGYDSWGCAVMEPDGELLVERQLGAPSAREVDHFGGSRGTVGIGHTRWATHGAPSLRNTHPIECGDVLVVHNGIIDNHAEVRLSMQQLGVVFKTDTDSECIAAVLSYSLTGSVCDRDTLRSAVAMATRLLEGSYSFLMLHRRFPGMVAGASHGAPLVMSRDGRVASDVAAFVGESQAWRIKDGTAFVLDEGYVDADLEEEVISVPTYSPAAEGSSMLAEIHEQADLVTSPWPGELPPRFEYQRLVLFGCGSSYNAALLGRRLMRQLGLSERIDVEYATEMMTEGDSRDTLYVALTQSGETRDTLRVMEALPQARKDGRMLVLTAHPHSKAGSLGRVIDIGSGLERGVAATKSFTMQVLRLYQLGWLLHVFKHPADLDDLQLSLAASLRTVLSTCVVGHLASLVRRHKLTLLLGSGAYYAVAREAALKLQEVAYIHAQALPASEVKHGPIALVDDDTLSFVLLGADSPEPARVVGNIQEIRARGGKVVAVVDGGVAPLVEGLCEAVTVVPADAGPLGPLVINVVLQLVAHQAAWMVGLDADRPRNLAKCITV